MSGPMDIVERLRLPYELPLDQHGIDWRWLLSDRKEAADEIEILRARLDELRCATDAKPIAWMTVDGREVCTDSDKSAWARQQEMVSIAAEHSVPLYAASLKPEKK